MASSNGAEQVSLVDWDFMVERDSMHFSDEASRTAAEQLSEVFVGSRVSPGQMA